MTTRPRKLRMTKRVISFSEFSYKKLAKKAERLGIAVSELTRRIVDAYFEAAQ